MQPAAHEAPDSVHAAIRRERRPLPPHEPDHDPGGANYRRWAATVCAAEARHAADDFWACVYRLGLAALFDRDDPSTRLGAGGFGGHEAPFRFAHETHAFAVLSWLSHLQAHESDRRGPWAAVRWHTWDAGRRREWFVRRRYLWSGFVRQVERYRAARRRLAAASQPLAEISELVTRVTAPSSSGLAMPKNLATTAEPLCRSMAARSVKRS
jgi:hypothetical protein